MAFLWSRLSWGRTKGMSQLEEGSFEGRSKRSSSSARSRRSLLSKTGDISPTCQEASHYPLYDATDPEHNTAVPSSATPSPKRKSPLERVSQGLRSLRKKFYKFDDEGKPIVHSGQDSPSKKSVKSVRFDSEDTIIRDTQTPASPISIPSGSFLPELELPLSILDMHGPSPTSLGLTARPVEEAPLTEMERRDDSFLEPVRSPLREYPPNLETPLPGANLGMELNPFDDVHKVDSPKTKQAVSPEATSATEQTELASRVSTNNSKKSFPEVFPEVDALEYASRVSTNNSQKSFPEIFPKIDALGHAPRLTTIHSQKSFPEVFPEVDALEHSLDAAHSSSDDQSAQYDADTESVTEPVKVIRVSPKSTKDRGAPFTDKKMNLPVSAVKSDTGNEGLTLTPTVSSTSPPRQTTFHTSDSGESCVTIPEGVPGPQRTTSIASQVPPLGLRRSQPRLGPRMIDITASKADTRGREYTGEVESDMSSMHLGSRASSVCSVQNKKPSTTACHSEGAPSVFSTRAKPEGTDDTDGGLLSHTVLSSEDLGMCVSISHGHGKKKEQESASARTDHQLEQ